MVSERFTREYPPFRDEFGCVNNLINGDSYLCANSNFIGERDAIDTAIEICNVFNDLYFENQHLQSEKEFLIKCLEECNPHIKAETLLDDFNGRG